MTGVKSSPTSQVIGDILATDLVPPAQGILLQGMGVLLAINCHVPHPSQPPGPWHRDTHQFHCSKTPASSGSHASLLRADRREQVAWPLTFQEAMR